MRAALASSLTLISLGLAAVAPVAAAAEPGFTVVTADGGDAVSVVTDPGIHVNADAPIFLAVDKAATLKGSASKEDGDARWKLGQALVPGQWVQLEFALCDDAETWCRFYKVGFDFDPSATAQATRQASGGLDAPPEEHAAHHPGLLDFAIQDDADAAFARARAEGKLVLMDFHAVWCPPCQMFASEGMADPGVRAMTDKLVVVQLDADVASSWSAKGRYAVRGYPTILLARADGQEISRLEGYPGVEELRRWLDTSTRSGHSLRELAQMRASGDRSPEVLTALARNLADLGLDEEAAQLYAEALPSLSGPEAVDAHLALLQEAAGRAERKAVKAEVSALLKAEPSIRVCYGIYEALSSTPEGNERLDRWLATQGVAAADALASAPGSTAATRGDALEAKGMFLERLEDEAGAKVAFSAAADAWLEVLAALPGEGVEKYTPFRGPARGLTGLLAAADRGEEAEALHKELVAAFPDEVTYFYDYARFLKGQDRLGEAEIQATAAVAQSRGDNRLWSVALLADILAAEDKQDDAIRILKETLDGAVLPDDTSIRTHRYVQRLEKQLEALEGGGQAAG